MTSFQNLDKWIVELKQHTDANLSVIIVGSKSDLKHLRSVETKRGQQYAMDHGMLFKETSALDCSNVTEAFEDLVMEIYKGVKEREKQKKAVRTLLPVQPGNLTQAVQNGTNGSLKLPDRDAAEEKGKHHKHKLPCCST